MRASKRDKATPERSECPFPTITEKHPVAEFDESKGRYVCRGETATTTHRVFKKNKYTDKADPKTTKKERKTSKAART